MERTVGGRLAAGERPLTARYALDEVLARGGVGEVWRARDLRLNRPVAVKVLHGAQADPHFRTRFRNEAQHAARLSHPNIAAVFDYGEEAAEDGDEPIPFLVMELVEGESLADLLARRGRLGVGRTLSILRQLSAGLAAAHEAGVVHRDVKPANVLVRPDGLVKITDFGIAASAASAALTETGQVMGTARYLSPEQARGRRGTPASDVYALGLVGYECLAGRPAFDGPDPVQVAAKQVSEPPPPLPPDVPEQVCGLVRTATAKDPARRLPDGAALRDALDRLLENGRRAARSAVPPRHGPLPGAPALGTRPLDETTVETTGPVPVPVPGRCGGATAAKNGDRRSRRRWWPVAVGGVLLCALATVLLFLGRSGAAGSSGTVRAGLEGGTAGATSTSDRARLPGAARVPGPATVAAPGAQGGAADAGGPTAPTADGPTAGSGVRGTARGHGALDAGTAATGAGDGTGTSTGAPTAGTGRTGTAGAATGSAGPTAGAPSAAGKPSTVGAPTGGSGSTAGPAGAATDTGSPSAGSTGSGSGGSSSAGSTGTSTGGSGSTSGSTAGPRDGGSTGTSGTEPAGGGTSGASGTDTSGTGASGTDRSGAGTPSTGTASTGSAGTPTPGA